MTGNDLIKKIKQTNLCDCEICVNFSFEGNGSYVVGIEGVSIECTDLNIFIDIGKIDDFIKKDYIEWWNSLSMREQWNLFIKYNPEISNAPATIGINLKDIEKSHIEHIWKSENIVK